MAHRLGTSSSDIVTAVDYLRSGGVVGVPTETVYGLAALAFSVEAVREIYRLKARPANNPLILHIHHLDQIEQSSVLDNETVFLTPQSPGIEDHFTRNYEN